MSFWNRFSHKDAAPAALELRREEAEKVSRSKEEFYKVMRRFAVEAGDEDSVRYYDDRLRALYRLQTELEVLRGKR